MGIVYCIILCVTFLAAVMIVCDCIEAMHQNDNDTERIERENRELWKRLDKETE